MIDFCTMPETPVEHFRDGDGTTFTRLVAVEGQRLLRGRLPQGSSIGWHCHDTSSEVIYILSGVGTILHEGVTVSLPSGTCHVCRKGESHSLRNEEEQDLEFFAVITDMA